MSFTTNDDRHRELLARLLFWGSPVFAAAIFISLATLTHGPPLGQRRITILLYFNALLAFAGSAAGGLLLPRRLVSQIVASLACGAVGAGSYVMLTLAADHLVPGF